MAAPPPSPDDALVWYVAYGSNLCGARLQAYLVGGDGPFGSHRGCRDHRPPCADRWLEIDRRIEFRGPSQRWGGGVAFLDRTPTAGRRTTARAWLLRPGQLLDLAAQEARLDATPPASILDDVAVDGHASIGGGWYDALLRLADLDGRPAFALTTAQDLPVAAPTDAYLAVIAAGRAERRRGLSAQPPSASGCGGPIGSGSTTTQRVPT